MGEDFKKVESNDSFGQSFSLDTTSTKLFTELDCFDAVNPLFETTNSFSCDSEPVEPKTFEFIDEATTNGNATTNDYVSKQEQVYANSFPAQSDIILSPARPITPSTSYQPTYEHQQIQSYVFDGIIPLNHASPNDPGLYDFGVSFKRETKAPSKNAAYTYSHEIGKLFANINKRVPISLHCSIVPPINSRVRICAMFKKAENANDIIKQCPNHNKELGEKMCNNNFIVADMALESYPQYSYDRNGRESVSILFGNGTNCTALLKLMCLSSCKVINRREIVLVFDLVNENGVLLGRQVVDFVVSTCPGRDRPKAENQPLDPQRKRRRVQNTVLSNVTNVNSSNDTTTSVEGHYTLNVKNFEDYVVLKKLRDALECMRAQGGKN